MGRDVLARDHGLVEDRPHPLLGDQAPDQHARGPRCWGRSPRLPAATGSHTRQPSQIVGQAGGQGAEDGARHVLPDDHHPLDLAQRVADQVAQPVGDAEQAHHAQDRHRESDQGQDGAKRPGQQVPPGENTHVRLIPSLVR